MRKKQSGFTMLELMITLIILGIMLGMGVPAMAQMIQSSTVSRVTNDLVRDFNSARSEAVDLNKVVTVCRRASDTTCETTGDEWQSSGWLVFVEPTPATGTPASAAAVIRDTGPITNTTITHNPTTGATFNAAFSFWPDGTVRDSTNTSVPVSMTVCPLSTDSVKGRQLYINERGDIRTRVADAYEDCDE